MKYSKNTTFSDRNAGNIIFNTAIMKCPDQFGTGKLLKTNKFEISELLLKISSLIKFALYKCAGPSKVTKYFENKSGKTPVTQSSRNKYGSILLS